MTDTTATATWYNDNAQGEHDRLTTFALEYAVSLHVILDCIESLKREMNIDKLKILDLGGGTGRYCEAFPPPWLYATFANLFTHSCRAI